jgi:hypothetical protein
MDAVDPRIQRKAFPEVPGEHKEGASGRVGLLMGQNNLRLFSIEEKKAGGLALFRSRFGTSLIVTGNAERLQSDVEPVGTEEGSWVMLAQNSKQVQEFLSAEALGIDLPRRCASCKEYQFRTIKEDQEYQVMQEGLKFNEGRKKLMVDDYIPSLFPPQSCGTTTV